MVVAAKELAIARLSLRRADIARLMDETNITGAECSAELADRVRLAISRASHRVPWRSDCLVQALAARRWLGRHLVRTQLSIGIKDPRGSALDAHAWLTCGDLIVTGGDVAPYVPLKPTSRPRTNH